jgi:hypothetical protein
MVEELGSPTMSENVNMLANRNIIIVAWIAKLPGTPASSAKPGSPLYGFSEDS